MHSAASAGYPGEHRIYMLMQRYYYWPGISDNVFRHMAAYKLYRRIKLSKEKLLGLLRPLPIPEYRWSDIAVDYIPALPASRHGGVIYKGILIMVDRLTKMAYFVPVCSLYIKKLADAFINRIYLLHSTPDTIVFN